MEPTLRILICDDEETAIRIISGAVEKLFLKVGVVVSLEAYTSAKKCVAYLRDNPVDLIFLDINMEEIDGIELCRQINANMKDRLPDVVFVSSKSDRVFDTFSVRPFGFIRKNNFVEDAGKVIGSYITHKFSPGKESDTLRIKNKNGITTIPVNDIEYVESIRSTQIVHAASGDVFVLRATMNEVEKRLKEADFIRVHKSFIVSCRKIVTFSRKEVALKSGAQVAVGRMYYKDAIREYLNFISENGNFDFNG